MSLYKISRFLFFRIHQKSQLASLVFGGEAPLPDIISPLRFLRSVLPFFTPFVSVFSDPSVLFAVISVRPGTTTATRD